MKNFDDWSKELADRISNTNNKEIVGTIHNLDDGGSVVEATSSNGYITQITVSTPLADTIGGPWGTWVKGEQVYGSWEKWVEGTTKNDLAKLLKPALRNYFELYHDSMIDELTEVVISSIDSEFRFIKKQ